MPAAGQLVADALHAATATLPGEGVDGAEAEFALRAMNRLLAAWGADGLLPPTGTLEPLTLTANQASYTVGVGGQMNTPRPDRVTAAWLRDAQGRDTPLDVWTREQWQGIATKSAPGTPAGVYYDPTAPYGTLHVNPVPTAPTTLWLDSLKPLPQFASAAASLALPGEYEEPLVYLTAERLCVAYGLPVSRDLARLVAAGKAALRKKNARVKLPTFPGLTRPAGYDLTTGGGRP